MFSVMHLEEILVMDPVPKGYVILLSGPSKRCCPISWSSNKIHRKVQSTFSAETLSTYNAVDEAIYIGHMLTELYYNDYLQNKIPVTVYTVISHCMITSTRQNKLKRRDSGLLWQEFRSHWREETLRR